MDRRQIPSLDDLRALEAVVRTGSMRAAADELALTHGAVSRRVSKLAGALGVKLLGPEGRGIRATDDGERLALATRQALRFVAEAVSEITRADNARSVLVSCERSVAMRWLIARLTRFQDAHPDLTVHLSVGGGQVRFPGDRPAIAIRRLDFDVDPRWSIVALFREETGPVMAPRLLDDFAAGQYLALGSRTRPDAWAAWYAAHPTCSRARETRLLDHHFLMVEAAAAGMGVALSPRVIAADDVASGRLIAPRDFDEDGSLYAAIMPADGAHHPVLAPVLNWLSEATSQFPRP